MIDKTKLYDLFFYEKNEKNSIPMLSKIRLVLIYSFSLINIIFVLPYALFQYPSETEIVRNIFLVSIILFILSPFVFLVSRNIQLSQWITATGIITLSVEEIIDLTSWPGWGPLILFALIPIFFLIFDFKISILLPVVLSAGTIIRLSLGGFAEESVFNDLSYTRSFITVILIAGILSSLTIISIRILLKHLNELAFMDHVTHLPNRNRLHQMITTRSMYSNVHGHSFTLIGIEILNFNNLNSNIGTKNCDLILESVAERLTSAGNEITGRWSGSIFMQIINTSDKQSIIDSCMHMHKKLSKAYIVNSNSYFVSFVLAASVFPDDGRSAENLTENIISLLDRKDRSAGDILFHDTDHVLKEQKKFRINEALNRADFDREFSLEYQPKINIRNNRCSSAEALLRWTNISLGQVPPSDFIPVAEETGLIRKLTRWVIVKAFNDRKEASSFFPGDSFVISINLSILDLKDITLIQFISDHLNLTGCRPSWIEFEVTESIQMDTDIQIRKNIQELNEMGFRIAIDDFGTGYSSFNYLHNMEVHNIKIDKSFIDPIKLEADSTKFPVVDAIISMANTVGIEVTAEGVENRYQLDYLKEKKCTTVQGWLFAKSMPLDQLREYLKES